MIVFGAGGFGLEVIDGLESNSYSTDEGSAITNIFLSDDDLSELKQRSSEWNVEILSDLSSHSGKKFSIAIGDPLARKRVYQKLLELGLKPTTLVHNSAVVSHRANVGRGCIVGPFAYIGPLATIMTNVVLNTYSSVGHHASVGESSVLSPYAAVNGAASIGECCFMGTKSTVSVGVSMGGYGKLSTGSVLTDNSKDGSLSIGNPAKSRVMFSVPQNEN